MPEEPELPDTKAFDSLPEAVQKVANEQGLGPFLWWCRSTSFFWKKEAFLFKNGMICTETSPFSPAVTAAYHWADVHLFRGRVHAHVSYMFGHIIPSQHHYKMLLTFKNGKKCTVFMDEPEVQTPVQHFFKYGPAKLDRHAERVWLWVSFQVGEAQYKQIQPQLEAGRIVKFGAISASQAGLSFKGKFFPWEEISHLYAGYVINPYEKKKGDYVRIYAHKLFQFPRRKIDNVGTLVYLYETMTPSR